MIGEILGESFCLSHFPKSFISLSLLPLAVGLTVLSQSVIYSLIHILLYLTIFFSLSSSLPLVTFCLSFCLHLLSLPLFLLSSIYFLFFSPNLVQTFIVPWWWLWRSPDFRLNNYWMDCHEIWLQTFMVPSGWINHFTGLCSLCWAWGQQVVESDSLEEEAVTESRGSSPDAPVPFSRWQWCLFGGVFYDPEHLVCAAFSKYVTDGGERGPSDGLSWLHYPL